jgi:hypothetical protein
MGCMMLNLAKLKPGTYADFVAIKRCQIDDCERTGDLHPEEAAVLRARLDALATNPTAAQNLKGFTWGRA